MWFNLQLIRESRKQLLNQFKTGSNSGVTLFKPPDLCSVIPLSAELIIPSIIRVHTHQASDTLVALPLGSVHRPVNINMLRSTVGARSVGPNCC